MRIWDRIDAGWVITAVFCLFVGSVVSDANDSVSLRDTSKKAEKTSRKKGGTDKIHGDAVIESSRLALRVQKDDGRLSIAYKLDGKIVETAEARLVGKGDDVVARLDSIRIDQNSGAEVSLWVEGVTKEKHKLPFAIRVRADAPIFSIQPEARPSEIKLNFRSSHSVVPDIFGDDLVFRSGEGQKGELTLPAGVAFVQLLDGGDAMMVACWTPVEKEVVVRSETESGMMTFTRAEIPMAGKEGISIAVLADRAIWREENAAQYSFSEHRKTEWMPPFPARYRCDLKKKDSWGLTDSWRRATSRERVWCSFLNYCYPPLSFVKDGAYLRIPKYQASGGFAHGEAKAIQYDGPILLYPFDRERNGKKDEKTPPDKFTVLDVVANTLGRDWLKQLDVGEGVLEDEPYPEGYVYTATCGCTGDVEKIFKEGKERKKAGEIRLEFGEMDQFVRYNRKRIEEYVAFSKTYKEFAVQQSSRGNADLTQALADLQPLVDYIPEQYRSLLPEMKTPEDCAKLSSQVIALIDSHDQKKLKRVQELGKAIRVIGGTQDDLLAACRFHVKLLRQKAGLIHARSSDPATRETMRGILRLTQTMLRIRSPYEGH